MDTGIWIDYDVIFFCYANKQQNVVNNIFIQTLINGAQWTLTGV